ncbi:MAG TPA: ribonuclease HII [Actinomycetota bacterium]|nr:ribonuclease HII [Actinomycetota bacterium]
MDSETRLTRRFAVEAETSGTGKPIDHYERRLRAEGFQLIAGIDEAGRGALAGPLVAAAVVLPDPFDIDGLADSKALTALQREEWFGRIQASALAVAVCRALPRRIDHRGLHVSNLFLLKRVLRELPLQPDFVLADGFHLKGVRLPCLSIKKGDEVTASVAAASIVAKVTRDRIMDRYHRRFPQYGFDRHRGYGTMSHRAAIARFGPSPIHRMSFKGMNLWETDRERYLELYARDDPGD